MCRSIEPMRNTYIIFLFLWINFTFLNGQDLDFPTPSYLSFINAHEPPSSTNRRLNDTRNELDLTLTLFFNGYKSYVSSQDVNACTFEPSCSSYGLIAVQKRGVFMGMLKTFDRLTRCHALARELYEINTNTGFQIDKP